VRRLIESPAGVSVTAGTVAYQLVVVKIALPDTDDLEGSSLEDFLDLIAPLLG
jgi:hypothetical protein